MKTGSMRIRGVLIYERAIRVVLCMFAIVAICGLAERAALAQGVADRFPDPNRVAVDFPDEVERYVVLNLLWDASREKAPGDTAKRGAYYRTADAIRMKYSIPGGAAYDKFSERNFQLNADANFRRTVLEKYHLTNLPVARAAPAMRNTDVTDAMIKGAFLKASPFIIGSLLVMVWLMGFYVRKASTHSAVNPAAVNAPSGLPALPESLRVVSLPRLQYSVDVVSARAVEKETTMHTHVHTSTSGGEVYTVGNQVQSTPIQSSTSVTTTQQDLVWVRTADNRETSWVFKGGTFKVRPGHILSVITHPGSEGSAEFLMAYNHNTGQFEELRGIPYGIRGGIMAWLIATLVGSVGFAIAFGIILSIQPDSNADPARRMLGPIVNWIMGVIASAIAAFFISMTTGRKLFRQRNASYQSQYVPRFRQFLEQCTPALQKHFAAP
jgi:hypothetical protein